MSWRVVVTETALEGLSDAEKAMATAELFAWVEAGPPRRNRRRVFGARLFERRTVLGLDQQRGSLAEQAFGSIDQIAHHPSQQDTPG